MSTDKTPAETFLENSMKTIEALVLDKLKTLGITTEDIMTAPLRYGPKKTVYRTDTMIREQYEVMGISLIQVEWTEGSCLVTDPTIEDPNY